MASHYKDTVLHGEDHPDTHASATRWRHQESSSFRQHAALSGAPKQVREADEHHGISDLADFLNKSRVDGTPGVGAKTHMPIVAAAGKNNTEPDTIDTGVGAQNMTGVSSEKPGDGARVRPTDGKELRCGPLLNYRRIEGSSWYGSVLIVTKGGPQRGVYEPELILRRLGTSLESANDVSGVDRTRHSKDENWFNGVKYNPDEQSNRASILTTNNVIQDSRVKGVKLYADLRNVFWRFQLQVEMEDAETQWEYEIPGLRFASGVKKTDKQSFFVPASTESFRIMFYSCNGFSEGTDEEAWSGPALWNDVVRVHKETPFHVMIGGGDQIYNDGISVSGPLRPWSNIPNPKKRRLYKFPESLRKDCDDYYVTNYIRWYSNEPFASANGQIPQLNLWDDHDIIDGFGSYVSDFMKCDVFRGIGGTAYKYYMLFQHHLPPPISTYTTDAPQTMEASKNGIGADPEQLKDTFVLQGQEEDPSYIIGPKPGPYVQEYSRSIYARLGARIAFFGIDARTERTRRQINYPETYEKIFARVRSELGAAASSSNPIQHLIVLLGIPIAYPRLTWLENILRSPLIGPIKFLNKRFGLAGGLFNHFDGGVDLLDDLDDHYTAKQHKHERLNLVLELQKLAAEFSVRVTVLGGDVHLAACGRFYSNPQLGIPALNDHRYITNIISSAIVNKPPPSAIANLLARRNKIHHLDENTNETLLELFDKTPGQDMKSARWNHVTMPSRNFAMITENPLSNSVSTSNGSPNYVNGNSNGAIPSHLNNMNGTSRHTRTPPLIPLTIAIDECTGKEGHSPLHEGELNTGTQSRAVHSHGKSGDGSLDVCICVEKNQKDKEGHTQGYGMWIPMLKYKGDGQTMRKRDNIPGAVNART